MDKRVIKLSVTNCYLIANGNSYLLVDTGYDYEWDLFYRRLAEAGVSFSQISHLLLTHHHDDHCGLLNRVIEQNEDIRVIMSQRARDLILGGKNDHAHGGGYINRRVNLLLSLKKMFDKRWTHTFPPYRVRENDILIEGDTRLSEIGIGINGKILETPGHSVDSISLLFDDGDCLVGDAAANFLQFAGTKYCVIYIEDMEEYYRSWQKLIAEGSRQIFPAHGSAFPVEKLKQNIGKNNQRNMVMIA